MWGLVEGGLHLFWGCATQATGRMQGATMRRRNAGFGLLPGLSEGFGREGLIAALPRLHRAPP